MRPWVLVAGAALLGALFMGVLRVPGLGDMPGLLLSDGGQLVAAGGAAFGCAVAARRTRGHRRRSWWWLSAGTGCWALGQVVWSYYEVVLDREVPFPSLADIGFLLFPLAAAVGLVIWLGTQSDQIAARGRDLMDGAIIAGSLLLLSWITTLGSVVAGGANSPFAQVLSLAYPVGDLILATLVLIALARGTGTERTTLAVLAVGLFGLAVSDSAYVYLTSEGNYTSADVVSSGWVFGFLMVGAAGLTVRREPARTVSTTADLGHVLAKPSTLRLALPYVPLVAAGLALSITLLTDESTPAVALLIGLTLVLIVLTRQFLAMLDNQRLLLALADARDQLHQQAMHDALTGLANRVLFGDRLDRALLAPGANVGVLFCDLDDFKLVNDELGHDAGDALLVIVAERLLSCVRTTDTVARLGGDEFAILLQDSADAVAVADRVVKSMQEPVEMRGRTVRTSISVGIAHHESAAAPAHDRRESPATSPLRSLTLTTSTLGADADRASTAALLLRHADTAMYAAKGAGKSRAVLSDVAS